MAELVNTVNLTKTFSGSGIGWFSSTSKAGDNNYAVRSISLGINRGEILGLVGESGSGKSTFARCILKLLEPTSGDIYFDGQEISKLNKNQFQPLRSAMQMIFQSPAASLNPRMKVGTTVLDPVKLHLKLSGSKAKYHTGNIFEMVGLSVEDMDKFPHQLSGGQQQRVGIARAIASNPKFLVLDEPTSALDASVRGQILNLLRELRTELEMTYLFISHDLSTIYNICDRAAVLYRGVIVEMGGVTDLFENPQHPYTKNLVEAIPSISPGSRKKQQENLIPQPLKTIQPSNNACVFMSRCSIASNRCNEAPTLTSREHGHMVSCWAIDEPNWPQPE
jgi:oligopeptide/dipeptide ABC transporter ATP-binding protein